MDSWVSGYSHLGGFAGYSRRGSKACERRDPEGLEANMPLTFREDHIKLVYPTSPRSLQVRTARTCISVRTTRRRRRRLVSTRGA